MLFFISDLIFRSMLPFVRVEIPLPKIESATISGPIEGFSVKIHVGSAVKKHFWEGDAFEFWPVPDAALSDA